MLAQRLRRGRAGQHGGALLLSLISVVAIAGVMAALFVVSLSSVREVSRAGRQMRALYIAEAGLADSLLQVSNAIRDDEAVPAAVGTAAAPIELDGGRYWATIVDNGNDTYTVTATGQNSLSRRSLQALVESTGGSVFDHAIFAGNTSGDPGYTLTLSGTGSQADSVTGNVYSNGNVEITGDASTVGDVVASGTVSGLSGTEGETRPVPDIAGMDYANNNDVNVADAFASASWNSNSLGGSAWELPESDPAHIFRLNPNDRTDETSGTAKDDYFLEDPYMPVKDFTAASGKKGHTVSLSGASGYPGSDGNGLVYYIDGNLWIHNKPWGRMRFDSSGDLSVTFIVKGNVYFSDDVLLIDEVNDAVAFIAIKDEAEPDSGNIYLGDPRYGTLDSMYAYLYAENDFIDLNLDASGSKKVELYGNMTAGNHVDIQRDYVKSDGSVEHSKLTVEFDDRLSVGNVELPGIPLADAGVGGYRLVGWREAPNP